MEKKRKTIIFKDIGFSIDIQTNLKEVDFFDVTLNLQNDTYRLCKKPNEKLLYIHSSSNHPRKSSNSYQIPSLKDCRKILPSKKFSIQQKLNVKIR